MSKFHSKISKRIGVGLKGMIVGAATFALIVPLAACSTAGDQNDSEPGASGKVTVWTFLNPSTGESPREVAFAKLIKSFETEHKDIQIVVEPKAYQDLATLYLSAFALGNEPDLIMVNTSSVGTLAAANSLADLDKITTEDFRENVLPDLAQGYLKAQSIDGVQYTIPQWPNTGNVIMYRSDLVGETLPTDAYDFIGAVADTTEGKTFGYGLRGVSTTGSIFFDMSAGHGPDAWQQSFDDEGRFDFLSPEARQTAEWVRQLGQSGALAPDATTATDNDIQDQFAAGRFAVAAAYGPRFTTWPDIAAGYDPQSLRFTSYPTFNGNGPAPLESGWTWGISSHAKNQDAAVAFMESLYTSDASLVWAKDGGQIPDRLTTLKDPFFTDDDAGKVITKFADLAFSPGAVSFPANLANPLEVFKVANDLVRKLIETSTPVDTLLKEAKANAYGG